MNIEELRRRQNLPISEKIELTKKSIKQFYDVLDGQIYVSFSGGKDSTVLLDIAREVYPDIKAVFCDTGLEYPEIRDFIKDTADVTWIKPKMTFYEVLKKKGYPVISKEQVLYIRQYRTTKSEYLKSVRWNGKNGRFKISEKWKFLVNAPFAISEECCNISKKNPFKKFGKETLLRPLIGTFAADSRNRFKEYMKHGCNNFDKAASEQSTPMGFWTEKDVWKYLKVKKLSYCKIYDCGIKHTGCIYCLFGIHLEKGGDKRFAILKYLHPELYDYCMDKLGIRDVLAYINYDFKNDAHFNPTLSLCSAMEAS